MNADPTSRGGTDELKRRRLTDVLTLVDPAVALADLVSSGFFAEWFPEVEAMAMQQDPIHRHKDVLTHSIAVTAKTPPEFRVRLAALLHDVGKPATRRFSRAGVTFWHHEAVGARASRLRLSALGFPEPFVTDVARLVELSGRFHGYRQGWTDAAVRRYARDAGHLLGDLNTLVRCDCTTRHQEKVAALRREVDDLERRIRQLARDEEDHRRRPPLSGDQVMTLLDIGPGRQVGAVIAALVVERAKTGTMTEREAVEFVQQHWQGHADPEGNSENPAGAAL